MLPAVIGQAGCAQLSCTEAAARHRQLQIHQNHWVCVSSCVAGCLALCPVNWVHILAHESGLAPVQHHAAGSTVKGEMRHPRLVHVVSGLWKQNSIITSTADVPPNLPLFFSKNTAWQRRSTDTPALTIN